MHAAAMKNFHLPLSAALYTSLREEAARNGAPATELARQAIQVWLHEQRRRKIQDELAVFVEANAGSVWDLDPQWEAAGVESLAKLPVWSDSHGGGAKATMPEAAAARRDAIRKVADKKEVAKSAVAKSGAAKSASRRASRKAAA